MRSDTVVGLYKDAESQGGRTIVSFLTAMLRVPGTGPDHLGLDLLIRAGYVTDVQPTGKTGSAFTNVLVGSTYSMRLPHQLLMNVLLGVAPPVGTGNGNAAAPEDILARQHGAAARSGFDLTMATNDLGFVGGVGVGWVSRGWTLQGEVTLSKLYRVMGEVLQPDARRTNSVLAVHAGYFVAPFLSIGTELRYMRWLVEPVAVQMDPTGDSRDNLTTAVGVRFHVHVGHDGSGWLRPGIAYVRALDRPLAGRTPDLQVIQLDIPYVF